MKNNKNLKGLWAIFCAVALLFGATTVLAAFPAGWVGAEYITTVGGAYVKTGLAQSPDNVTNSVVIDTVWEVTEFDTGERRLMGFNGVTYQNYFGLNKGDVFESEFLTGVKAQAGMKYHLHFTQSGGSELKVFSYDEDPNKEILLGSTSKSSVPFNSSECQIFSINWKGGGNDFNCEGIRVYSFKVYFDGALVGDFKPAYNESTQTSTFFDPVSGKLSQVSGSGYLSSNLPEPLVGSVAFAFLLALASRKQFVA